MTTEENWTDFNGTLTTTVVYRVNCSLYNPCGRNGHCRDNDDGEWPCKCKFWWNGTLCDELSNSGEQVITLGVLLGVLLIIFYGLALFRSFRKKRRQSKTISESTSSKIKQKFPTIPIRDFHPSRRLFSYITGILTVLVATATLLAKWSILKPIHEEIVGKYQRKEPLFFNRHSICKVIDLTGRFNLLTFPVACLFIILLTIITKRAAFYRNRFCRGYIGIPIPFDFFGHVKRTLAAVIFAIFADELLEIASEIISGGDGQSEKQGIIVRYLIQLFRVFVIGLRRYPILAAVYIDNCFSLICATLYVWLDYSVTIVYSGLCRSDFYPTDQNYNQTGTFSTTTAFVYYGTGSKILFLQLLNDIPRYLCLAYISVKLPMLLIKRIRERNSVDRRLTREQKDLLHSSLPHSVESRYVKGLLGMHDSSMPSNRLVQIFGRVYAWRDDFRYSSRVICVYASLFLLLFFLTVQITVQITPKLDALHKVIQILFDLISRLGDLSNPNFGQNDDKPSDFPVPKLARPFLFAVYITLFLIVFQLLVMLAGIRRNLLQAFRGDSTEIPQRNPSNNVSYVNGNFHFVGYLIGYVILAYVFLLFIAVILAIAIDAFITFGSVRFLEIILKIIIPIVLFMGFKLYLNKILGQYVFLQHHGEVLFINNRRAFMVFLYFNCFLDAFLGLFAAIFRFIKSIIGGLLYMCRLDYSPMGRKLETMDEGFSAYCGFIYIESAHRHPILLCFVSHLLRDYLYPSNEQRLSKARHKWRLAVFLLNNPILIYRRKGFLSRVQQNDINMMLVGGTRTEEVYIEQPPILAHRASIISEKALQDLWERHRF